MIEKYIFYKTEELTVKKWWRKLKDKELDGEKDETGRKMKREDVRGKEEEIELLCR